MKHKIDPMNDFVVKMILARQEKSHVLVHFLNSVIEPCYPIIDVFIQDPHEHRKTEDDKLSIADILAKDSNGHFYQIEIQNSVPSYLHSRMTYTSNAIYSSQLDRGEQYDKVNPIHSIWLLNENMFDGEHYCHRLKVIDQDTGAHLPDSNFYIIEMAKWQSEIPLEEMNKEQIKALQPLVYWLYFLREAKNWLSLPSFLQPISIMRELMAIIREISEREHNLARYLSAQDALRVKLTDEHLRNKAEESLKAASEELSAKQDELSAKQDELSAKQDELSAKQDELSAKDQQLEKLRKKLFDAGIDPDEA